MSEQFFWYVARGSGIAAWALAMASVLWGTALATRALGNKPKAPWLLDLHRHLGGLTVAFALAHIGALAADNFIHFGWADTFVPFASSWKPAATAWGVIGFWMLIVIEGTSLLMRRIPKRVWRGIHITSYLVAGLTTAHLFSAGTDATHPALLAAAGVSALAMVFMVVYRALAPRRAARSAPPKEPASAETG